MNNRPLTGIGVLVTRPAHQAGELQHAIEEAGGNAVLLPVIDIVPRARTDIKADLESLPLPDIAIFVSANAVSFGLDLIDNDRCQIAAIGPATARALAAADVRADIQSQGGFDTEHLLASNALQHVGGKTILIVRGRSGRELLAETLRERGARVDYLPVYERKTASPDAGTLKKLEKVWRNGQIEAVMVMSVASLHSMLELLPAYCMGQLSKTRLVAPSIRVIQTALERIPGLNGILSPGPGALDMTGALIAGLRTDSDTDHG
ncbi:MAG: uroporphyrinogen-III synthase [Gammaproteobacteria bacterium]|nr:uroporphyrinogen-III synthase [Gammaproteobacteria bacterium]